jgi:hypothetical protein
LILFIQNGDWFFFCSFSFKDHVSFCMKFHPTPPPLAFHSYNVDIYKVLRFFLLNIFSVLLLLALSRSIASWITRDNIRIGTELPEGRKWKYWKKMKKKLIRVSMRARVQPYREITMLQFTLIHTLASFIHSSIFFVFFSFIVYCRWFLVMLLFVVQELVCMFRIDDRTITQI